MQITLSSLSQRLETIAVTLQDISLKTAAAPKADAAHNAPCTCSGAHRTQSEMPESPKVGTTCQPVPIARRAKTPSLGFVERKLAARKQRLAVMDQDLLFDPAWWMLVDLFCAELRGKRLSVTAVTIGSGVPETTALRYLHILEERGYVERVPDETDRRRMFVRLARRTYAALADYMIAQEAATSAESRAA